MAYSQGLPFDCEEIVGESQTLKTALTQARIVAPSDATVLIEGETGTGKDLMARAIHRMSLRRNESFLKLNCAASSGYLMGIELFGSEKRGSISAVSERVGALELADRGTLFLDNIEGLPPKLQLKLLRTLQDGEFQRLGSSRTIRVDIRLLAASDQDLAQRVAQHSFRADLYYRLGVFRIRIPALRERREDIPLLANYFVQKYGRRLNKPIESIPIKAVHALAARNWPGNIRELENLIERSVIHSEAPVLGIVSGIARSKKSSGQVLRAHGTR
ncbi:MAG: sigma 54-interacting transcriptional regulator [Terriglobales bacterium]